MWAPSQWLCPCQPITELRNVLTSAGLAVCKPIPWVRPQAFVFRKARGVEKYIGAMPAAHGRKKKPPLRRKLKLKPRRSQCIKKKSQFKRKRQARLKPVMKHGKTSHWKPTRLPLDDSKALRQLQRNSTLMTNKAKMIMISFVKKLYKWVSVEAERLRRERKRSSIGFTEMRTALKSVMPVKCSKCKDNASKSGGSYSTKAS